jgi:hypothetical protein
MKNLKWRVFKQEMMGESQIAQNDLIEFWAGESSWSIQSIGVHLGKKGQIYAQGECNGIEEAKKQILEFLPEKKKKEINRG